MRSIFISKYYSVWILYVKSSIGKVLGIMILMTAAEGILFETILRKAVEAVGKEQSLYGYSVSLETVFTESRISWVFAAVFILISIILMTACGEYGSKTGYTLARLQITERAVFLMRTAANVCFYLLLLVWQILMTYGMARHYTLQPELYVTNQTIVLAYYRNAFLHGLLPLSDIIYWIRNILALAGLSVAAACYPILRIRTKVVPEAILWIAMTIMWFQARTGENNLTWLVILLILDAEMLLRIRGKGVVLDGE